MSENVLVIKLGALGDFIQAAGPFAAIRAHHADGRITLLTTAPFADFAQAAPWFDEVWTDRRPGILDVPGWLALRRRLRSGRFQRVYDLQTSDRSNHYFRLMGPGAKPQWSGIAPGCSHPHADPGRDLMHTAERQAAQLAVAGIGDVWAPDLAWASADIGRFGLTGAYALLVPGGAQHRPEKRWAAADFASLGRWAAERQIAPVFLGAAAEAPLIADIAKACPAARNLAGETAIADIIVLARGATFAVGNDTGPMHAIAAAGCLTVVLFSDASDPALCAQRGPKVQIMRRADLGDLAVGEVIKTLDFA